MTSKFFGKILARQLSVFLTVLMVITLLALSAVSYAEEIIYTGDKNKLQEVPSWFSYGKSDLCLFPGTGDAPLASGNKVTVNYLLPASEVTKIGLVFGGLSESMDSSNNSVFLLNGQIAEGICGGYSDDGNAGSNAVAISGGSVGQGVIGGFSNNGGAAGNKVSLDGGAVGEELCGGMGFGNSPGDEVMDNTVTISGGYVAGLVVGGVGQERVTRNMVTVSGGFAYSDVYGGNGGLYSVAYNTVKVTGGSVGGNVLGGFGYGGDTVGNMVIISGGLISGDVCGGYNAGYSKDDIVANNIVEVSGGSVLRGVCGGGSRDGDAINNHVTISGRPNLEEAYIRGGYTSGVSGDAFTGNTLHFKSSGISARAVDTFEYYHFYLPPDLAANGVMLSVSEQVNLKGTTVAISLPDVTKLKKGDKIALIHSEQGISNAPKNKNCQVKQGVVLYEFSIYSDKNNLWAQVTKVGNAAK